MPFEGSEKIIQVLRKELSKTEKFIDYNTEYCALMKVATNSLKVNSGEEAMSEYSHT